MCTIWQVSLSSTGDSCWKTSSKEFNTESAKEEATYAAKAERGDGRSVEWSRFQAAQDREQSVSRENRRTKSRSSPSEAHGY